MIGITITGGLVLESPDWERWIRPGVLHVLNGQAAYGGTGFYNPPWTVILGPIAILPPPIDRVVLLAASLAVYARLACCRSGCYHLPSSSRYGSDSWRRW